MRILIVADDIKNIIGGAEESLNSIIEYLKEKHDLEYLEQFSFKYFKLISLFNFDYLINILRIRKKIMEFSPDVIITQNRMSFPAIIYANIKKIPIINFVHDITNICPKYVDIIDYGISCVEYLNRKQCFECINNWKQVSVEIGGKSRSRISPLFYKFRYYLCKKNKKILLKSKFNFVPSDLLQDKLFPIQTRVFNLNFFKEEKNLEKTFSVDAKTGEYISDEFIGGSEIIYIVPKYDNAHKGTKFVLELADNMPNAQFIIIGKKLEQDLGMINYNVWNLERLDKRSLYSLFKAAKLTIVPSFMTESFGRVVIESLLQGTPVICSENVGAGHELIFRNENLNVLPINLKLWKEKINTILENNIRVSEDDIKKIKDRFSEKKSKEDLNFVLNMIYYMRNKKNDGKN